MKYVIAFDIVKDGIRRKAVKILLEYAYRVQKSVFEGFFSKNDLKECSEKLENLIKDDEDSVRFYPLCRDCEAKVNIKGIGKKVEDVDYIIL